MKFTKKDFILLKKHDEETYDKIRKEYINQLCLFLIDNFHLQYDLVKEIANDAFVRAAYYKIDLYDPNICSFKTWLFRIGRNECVNFLKKYNRHIYQNEMPDVGYVEYHNSLVFDLKLVLNKFEFNILIDYYVYEMSVQKLSKKYKLSDYKVRIALKEIVKKAQELLPDYA